MVISIKISNIVKQPDMDAIVNSANANLKFGSGVAGAIHTAAGIELERYCRSYAPLALGEAIITPGFALPNRFVIHTRAAHYLNDEHAEAFLSLAVENALRVAQTNEVRSVAMPAIGTGVFKFPTALAAQIMLKTIHKVSAECPALETIRICVATEGVAKVFQSIWTEMAYGQ